MKIIVVGNGKIGSLISEQLVQEGHDVVAVDTQERVLRSLQNRLDLMCINGNGATAKVLTEAGVKDADLVISVSEKDELNLLCCLIARKLGAKHTIARVRTPEYSEQMDLIKNDLGLSMIINPDLATAQEIFALLRYPNVISVEKFSKGKFELAEMLIESDCLLTQAPLHTIMSSHGFRALICTVRRGSETFIPNGDFRIRKGDVVSLSAQSEVMEEALKAAGIKSRVPRKVIIVGAGRIAIYLMEMMQKIGMNPTVIENNVERCRDISIRFPNALVIKSDGTEKETLFEEGITETDAFLALTGTDEVNILLGMNAINYNIQKVFTKISRNSLLELTESGEAGTVVSPGRIIADRVISYVRATATAGHGDVEALYHVANGTAEVVEFGVVDKNVKLTNIPLKDLKLKKDLLICCIIRNGKAIIPSGNDMIMENDHVVVVTANRRLNSLNEILR